MNDRELLENAAKAAGIKVSIVGHGSPTGPVSFYVEPGQLWWNPLEDDGDAFRLAVKLGMEVSVAPAQAYACRFGTLNQDTNEPHGDVHGPGTLDKFAATRRAIVRAAAAIGEQA